MGQLTLLGCGLPGGAGGPATLLLDTFADTNGTGLAAHTMNVGGGWTVHSGTYTIQSNRADAAATAVTASVATADAGAANGTVSTTHSSSGDNGVGNIVIRFTDTNNYWSLALNYISSAYELYKIVAGVPTLVDSVAFNPAGSTTYTLAAVCDGNQIDCTLDGANAIDNGGDSAFNTNTRFGIRGYCVVGAGEVHSNDDFQMTDAV